MLMQSLSRTILFLILLFTALLPLASYAQPRQVFVTASLIDKRDLFIENLERQEVQILENDQPRNIEFMARDEVPAVYGLLFDRSLMPEHEETPRFDSRQGVSTSSAVKSLAYALIDKYLGKQTLWVGVYDRELQVLLDFSPDTFRAKDAIQKISGRYTTESSFLYSALYSSVMRMKDRNEKRRVLIAFLDVTDYETTEKLKPLKNLLSSSNIEVFYISYATKLGGRSGDLNPVMNQAALKDLARATAGDTFFAADYREHIEDVIRRICDQLRTFYTFGFESQAPVDKPAKLTIRCTRPGSRVKSHPNVPIIP
jgi:VWFA-related protein